MILVSGIAVVDLIASGLPHVARPGELVFPAGRDVFGPFCTMSAAQAPSTGWTLSLQPS
jgi:hypothetical protein